MPTERERGQTLILLAVPALRSSVSSSVTQTILKGSHVPTTSKSASSASTVSERLTASEILSAATPFSRACFSGAASGRSSASAASIDRSNDDGRT